MIIFIAGWESVDMRVVEQALLTIAPGEPLIPNSEMFIWLELGPGWGALPLMLHVEPHIDGHQDDAGDCHKEGQVLPCLGTRSMRSRTRHQPPPLQVQIPVQKLAPHPYDFNYNHN